MSGYSGTPLPKKLGIQPEMVVGLIGAPADFGETLGEVPDGVVLRKGARGNCDLFILFARSRKDLDRVARLTDRLADARLWIAWPKKASGVSTDVSETDVRGAGLDAGLVDYKICAIDGTWSGLLFTRRG